MGRQATQKRERRQAKPKSPARPRSNAKPPAEADLVINGKSVHDFKVLCVPVFAVRNDKNEIVDELQVEQLGFTLYKPEFGDLEAKIAERLPQIRQAYTQQQFGG